MPSESENKAEAYSIKFNSAPFERLASTVRFKDLFAEAKGDVLPGRPGFYFLWSFLFAEGRRLSKGHLTNQLEDERRFSAVLHRHIKTSANGAEIVEHSRQTLRERVEIDGEKIHADEKSRIYVDVSPEELERFEYFVLRVPLPHCESDIEFVNAEQLEEIGKDILKLTAPRGNGSTKERRSITTVRWNVLVYLAIKENKGTQLKYLLSSANYAGRSPRKHKDLKGSVRDYIRKLVRDCLDYLCAEKTQKALKQS